MQSNGEVSERFKELVLKTSDSERNRGFESHPLRQRIIHGAEHFQLFPLWMKKCGSDRVGKGLPC